MRDLVVTCIKTDNLSDIKADIEGGCTPTITIARDKAALVFGTNRLYVFDLTAIQFKPHDS